MVAAPSLRSEEHTSELQSLTNLVCRLLLEKKKTHSMLPSGAVQVARGATWSEGSPCATRGSSVASTCERAIRAGASRTPLVPHATCRSHASGPLRCGHPSVHRNSSRPSPLRPHVYGLRVHSSVRSSPHVVRAHLRPFLATELLRCCFFFLKGRRALRPYLLSQPRRSPD